MVLPDYPGKRGRSGPLRNGCHDAECTTRYRSLRVGWDAVAWLMASQADLVLALGGGTARAMAHVGVIRALNERGIEPAGMAGTSFGAIVAALWALGTGVDEMEQLLTEPAAREVWAQGLDFGLHTFSLIHGRRLERWLDARLYRGASFDDLSRPLVIATTNLNDGGLELITGGRLASAVVASCSLPLLFAPVHRNGHWLVDGGFVEAVPFQAAASLGEARLLGVHTGIDTERAAMARWIVRTRERAWAGRLVGWGVSRSLDTAAGRVLRGLGWGARKYGLSPIMPREAMLLQVNPGIAWWDFHRTDLAVQAGVESARAAFDSGLLDRLRAPGEAAMEVKS